MTEDLHWTETVMLRADLEKKQRIINAQRRAGAIV